MIANPNFLMFATSEPDVLDHWLFKLLIKLGKMKKVWKIKGLRHQVAKMRRYRDLVKSFCNHCTFPLLSVCVGRQLTLFIPYHKFL